MEANQRKRRLNSSTFVGCSLREQREYQTKKKKSTKPQDDLNTRFNISLEWDERNKSVVAKKEQIGLSQRDLFPFIDAVSHRCSSLADITSVPRETFELKDLAGVLSYEVWHSHFSDTERNILAQYLPKGAEADKVVQELLSGDNIDFGNPFIKWGALLCSGKLHPDDVLLREQRIKANKNLYFSELQKYHNEMIENLRGWKDTLDRCKGPREEILQKIWKSRKQTEKEMQPVCETIYHDPEDDDDVTTPESSSWATSEKACSNDYNITRDSQGRKVFSESNVINLSDGLKVVKHQKGEKLQKRNIQFGDGARYMSYIKVSKEQHQRVKRTMKHSSNSIQPRSLNNVLGNLDNLNVQPFEVFEEEERQKLHDYWFQLVNKDIPAGFANWTERKLKANKMVKSLCQELEEKLKVLEEVDENGNSQNSSPVQLTDNVEATVSPTATEHEGDKVGTPHTMLESEMANQVGYEEIATTLKNEGDKAADNLLQRQTYEGADSMEADDGSDTLSAEVDDEEKMESTNSRCQVNSVIVESHDNGTIAKSVDPSLILSEYAGDINHVDVPAAVTQRDHRSSADDVWSAVSVRSSFYHPAGLGHQYASTDEFSLVHPQVMNEQQAEMIHLEPEAQGQATRRDLLQRQSDDLSFYGSFTNQQQGGLQEKNDGKLMLHRQPENTSFFSAYPSQDRSGLLESFFKVHGGGLPYHPEQKRMGLAFHQSDNLMVENRQFLSDFRDQVDLSFPPEMRQKRMNDIYEVNNIQDCVFPNGGRYSIPKQVPAVNMEDWGGVGSARVLAPSESHMTGGDFLSQSWFPGENRGRGGWSGLESAVALRGVGCQSNLDQSLFSILSECNGLRSVTAAGPAASSVAPNPPSAYESMGNAERFIESEGVVYSAGFGVGSSMASAGNILEQSSDPLVYLSRHEAGSGGGVTGGKNNNMEWMSVSHQNSGYLRSWNQ